MRVFLPPGLRRFVREGVDSGDFGSTDEMICYALRLLERQDGARDTRLGRLRRQIAIGLR